LALLANDVVTIDFHLQTEVEPVRALMRKFATAPMSLADACLVRMSELHSHTTIATTDSDFRVYRRNRRKVIPTIMPGSGG
jgi:uncharacterized protein